MLMKAIKFSKHIFYFLIFFCPTDDWCVWTYEAGAPFFITPIVIFFTSTVNFLKYFSINVVPPISFCVSQTHQHLN